MESTLPKQVILLRISLIGNRQVGKTSLMLKYTEKEHIVCVPFDIKEVQVDDCIVKIQFFDSSGQYSRRKILSSFYRSAQTILFIYSVSDRQSYEDLAKWINISDSIRKERCNYIIIGNKCDCQQSNRKITRDEAQRFALQNKCGFWQVSAQNGTNVKELFTFLAQQFHIQQKKLKEQKMKASFCSLI